MPVTNVALGEDWYANDETALAELGRLYSNEQGRWLTGPRWTFANDVQAAEASYARSNGASHSEMIVATFETQGAGNFIDDLGYDDEGWWANAWVRAFDLTGDPRYLAMAKTVFTDMIGGWDATVCAGGVWWTHTRTFKNAITNELFLLLAASLHNRTPNDAGPGSYLDWATREWTWFSQTGMINAAHLVNDGLTNNCRNNNGTTWTYNQGVILGGLVELFNATGDMNYIAQAEGIADAATARLVTAAGVLHEPCANAGCDDNQVNFKGIFVRNLARLNDVDGRAAYQAFLLRNARALWTQDRGPNDALGADWVGPFDLATAHRQSSAMIVLSALAEPSTQGAPLLRAAGGPSFNHGQGHPVGTLAWACDPPSCPTADFLQRGPFVSYLPPGAHVAHFRLAVDFAQPSADALATLDVYDAVADVTLARRDVAWSDFLNPNVTQDFALPVATTVAGHPIELRVRWSAVANAPQLTVTDVSVDAEQGFTASNLDHECGRLDRVATWSADRWRDTAPCYLTEGPGVVLGTGSFAAYFELRVDNFNLDDQPVATISVVDRTTGSTVASSDVTRGQFPNGLFQLFSLPFTAVADHGYDFRVFWRPSATAPRLTQRGVYVRPVVHDTSVTLAYNVRGVGNGPGDGSLDTLGHVLPAAVLGASLTANYHRFDLGPTGSGALNVVQGPADISLPAGTFTELHVIGFSTSGTQTNQPFVVTYADGSLATANLSLSDWASESLQPNERYAAGSPFRFATGAKEYGNIHLFHYVIPLDDTKALRTLRLPSNGAVKVLAATLSRAG